MVTLTDEIDEIMETYQYQMDQARIKKEEINKRLIKAREVEAEVNAEVAEIEKSIKPLTSK